MKLLILDGNSVINRAYYGVKPLTTREGLYTHAVYGFLNILEKRLQEQSQQTCEILKIKDVLNMDLENFIGKLQKADAFVIGAPLYVDGLPAQAVKLLEVLLEKYQNYQDVQFHT